MCKGFHHFEMPDTHWHIASGGMVAICTICVHTTYYVFSLGQFCKPIFFPALGEKSYLTDE